MMKLSLQGLASVKARIVGTATVLVVLFMGALGYALFSMNQIGLELAGIAELDLPITTNLTQITEHQLEQAVLFERAVRYGEAMHAKGKGAKAANRKARVEFNKSVTAFNALSEKVDKEILDGENLAKKAIGEAHNETELKEYKHVDEALKKIEKEHKDYARHATEVYTLLRAGNITAADKLAVKVEVEQGQLDTELTAILNEVEKFTEAAALLAEEHEQLALLVLAIVTLIALFLAIVFNWATVRSIGKSLTSLQGTMDSVTAGDYTNKTGLTGRDELNQLGIAFDQMLEDRGQFMKTEEENDALNNSIMAILRSVSNLGKGDLTTQAPVNEDITGALADAINQMSGGIGTTLENVNNVSQQVRNASGDARTITEQGKEAVVGTAKEMGDIRATIQETAKRIKRLGERSQEIGGIVKIIEDIAERTNVLALNANMQAAQAGEAGRGFMVVADEVQRLAESSKEATNQITKLVSGMQAETGETIATMDKTIEEVVQGGELAEQAAQQMERAGQTMERLDALGETLLKAVGSFKLPNVPASAGQDSLKAVG